MFSNDRHTMRQMYYQAWKKYMDRLPLSPLEQQIVDVIIEHPQYHQMMTQPEHSVDKDYFPEVGETNPFLHLSLHLAVRDQITTNRPAEIGEIFSVLTERFGRDEAEHLIMHCLAEILWQAQRSGEVPNQSAYLEDLKTLAATM